MSNTNENIIRTYKAVRQAAEGYPDLRASLNETAKGTLKIVAMTAIAVSILGPPGFVVGGVAGGSLAYATSQNFQPVYQILDQMSNAEKVAFVTEVAKIAFQEFGVDILLNLSDLHNNQMLQVIRKALAQLSFNVEQ